jgi:predicted pyridoxine 5'-phosphate oxidase superfamily flavin-nucleotide-binding protein
VGRGISSALPPGTARFLGRQRLVVASSMGADGRVWASLLTGPAGFVEAAGPKRLHLAAQPLAGDPLAGNLAARGVLGLLVFDPRTRERMRFNGRGLLSPEGISLQVEQAYGNCPAYIQLRRLAADGEPGPVGAARVARHLSDRQQAWIESADTFFIATWHPEGGADASHRGGFPGFVRVLGARRLAFEDYPGNGMFNTLGNLVVHPWAGLLFADFATGDLLQLTGEARVASNRAVTFTVEELRETPAATGRVLAGQPPAVTPRPGRHLKHGA